MAVLRTRTVAEAIRLAEDLKRQGRYDWFRGQTQDWRPLRTSLARLDESDQAAARDRLARFWNWANSVPQLASLAANPDEFFAVAQHYGIPTNYLDFTTEPRVAGFFATHDAPPSTGDADPACIMCLDTLDLAEFWEAIATARPDLEEPRCISVEVPELWRLHAQRGVFLYLPYADFDSHVYHFDRICFPAVEAPPTVIPEEDIYPPQKSELEILLDQYFMLEQMAAGSAAIRRAEIVTVRTEGLADGIEAECFGAKGLPEHESWKPDALAAWQVPTSEKWSEFSKAPRLFVKPAGASDPRGAIEELTDYFARLLVERPQVRSGPVAWESDTPDVASSLQLYWDGVRRWPYHDSDLASGMAVAAVFGHLVAVTPGADVNSWIAEHLATMCLGPSIEVEIGMTDGSYTRGFASRTALRAAVRPDLHEFLTDEWRPQIKEIQHVLQIVTAPRRAFVFKELATVFVRTIVPTQVVLRGEETKKARLYNIARAQSLGLP